MLVEKKEKQIKATLGELTIILTLETNVIAAMVRDVVFSCKRYGERQKALRKLDELVEIVDTYSSYGMLYVKECIKKSM